MYGRTSMWSRCSLGNSPRSAANACNTAAAQIKVLTACKTERAMQDCIMPKPECHVMPAPQSGPKKVAHRNQEKVSLEAINSRSGVLWLARLATMVDMQSDRTKMARKLGATRTTAKKKTEHLTKRIKKNIFLLFSGYTRPDSIFKNPAGVQCKAWLSQNTRYVWTIEHAQHSHSENKVQIATAWCAKNVFGDFDTRDR